ncbi:MAG: DNA polymerase/3'-5' exonuclease PolX [Candidatus Omnitrophota bacterium]
MVNNEISAIFRDIADILEIKGANRFRIRAYQRAAQNIDALSGDLETYLRDNRLTDIPGIGKDLSGKIREFYQSGKIRFYEELKKSLPSGLMDLLQIPSVGPKTTRLLYEKLKIASIVGLERAIRLKMVSGIPGIKEKTVENIKKGIKLLRRGRERMTLAEATELADKFVSTLKRLKEIKKIEVAGSLRRQKDTVGDVDILVVSDNPARVMRTFTSIPLVSRIQAEGRTKSSVRTRDDIQLDCRVVEARSFGAALMYFTGSKNFNIKLRQWAIRRGLKVNEYAILRNDKFIAGRTENEIFKLFGIPYIEPELREDAGELELALKGALPKLIDLKDVKGDLHVHSSWSDGRGSIKDISHACRQLGYSYVAVTDHSQGLKVANGLTPKDLVKKKREIDAINRVPGGPRLLYAAEVDIDSEGRLDYPDSILKEFDLVVASIHSGFKQSRQQLTRRIVKACGNKYAHIIGHPTGRLWGTREAYEIDLQEVFRAAHDTNTHFEINSFPERLDFNDYNCRRAKEAGIKLAISTDAHSVDQLSAMRFGLAMARRGWLEKKDVINTYPLEDFLKLIEKR